MSGQWEGRSNDGHARKKICFGRTFLFHNYDLILCPYPVSQVLQLEDTVERQQRFISRLEEERDRWASILTKDLTESDKIDKNGKIKNILTPDTWGRALNRPRGSTACWRKEEMQRQSYSTRRSRCSLQKKETGRNFLATFRWQRAKQS